MNAARAAEAMQSEICVARRKRRMPQFSHVLGSDWAADMNFDMGNVDAYVDYAYSRANSKYGELPYRESYSTEE